MKKNFFFKKKLIEIFEELSDEDAGELAKGILRYVNGYDTKLSGYLKIIFISIKKDIIEEE